MNAADIMSQALAEIAALPSAQQDEAGVIARQALQDAAAADAPRDYAAGLPPQIEAQIKQATFAFFQSLCDTARASPEALQQMFSRAARQQAQSKAKKRDGLILAKAPAIMDLRRFSYPGKTTQ
jgi:hypothetical protein